jgi:hypothetical protein
MIAHPSLCVPTAMARTLLTIMTPRRRYRCRFCGVFAAWLAVPGAPDGATLLHHMSPSHPAELRPYLAQMVEGGDITAVIVQAYKVVEDFSPNSGKKSQRGPASDDRPGGGYPG